jgi:phenylacetate-CoA ligase
MIRNYLPIDKILKSIMEHYNWFNWIVLYCNVAPQLLYGKKYRIHKKCIDKPFNYEEKIVQVFNSVVKITPYYKKRYSPIKSLDEFTNNINFIDKETVVNQKEEFVSETINRNRYIEAATGGTTGKPLVILMPKNRYVVELSTIHNLWNNYGWKYHKRGVLRNHKLPLNKIYKINPFTKEIIFDGFRMDESYAKKVHSILKKKNIKYIQAYPSSAFLFCKLCKDLNLDLSFIKAIFTSSEPVLDFQKNLILTQLGINLYNFYGHTEKLILGGYCACSKNIRFEPTYGFTELINKEGKQITTKGEIGELVGTTFNNLGMPLIRYKTGDFAEYIGNECPNCSKKGLTVTNIIGHRNNNIIYKSDGTYTTSTALNLHSNLLKYIDGLQYIQNKKGQLTIQIVKNHNFKEEHKKLLYQHFKNAMGLNSDVKISFVTNLTSLPNGKFPLVISSVKGEFN